MVNYYPLILVICTILGIVINFLYLFDIHYQFLDLVSVIMMNLIGFINSIVYSLTGSVKEAIKYDLCPCCSKEEP